MGLISWFMHRPTSRSGVKLLTPMARTPPSRYSRSMARQVP